jgi:8-oxo-dGTP pyrophosphatase MutT (NUDIX family)
MTYPPIDRPHLEAALALQSTDFDPLPLQSRMAPLSRPVDRDPGLPGQAREAATLLLLFPVEGVYHFVLTRRPDNLSTHAGQISFPGGRQEEGEDLKDTAFRETCEELGVCEGLDYLGPLRRIYIPPSDYYVSPFAALSPARPAWKYDPSEVAEVIEVPLGALLDETHKVQREGEFRGLKFQYWSYTLEGHIVWGATAIMLAEFEARLRHVLSL